MFVHGGYWQQLSKNDHSFPATAWTTAGYAFASINYGLAPTSTIPQMISRSRRAINWLGEHHSQYGYSETNVHVMGHSAGAHLLACAISPGVQDFDESALVTRPKRAILIGGIYDLEPISQTYVNDPLKLSILSARAPSPQFYDIDPLVALDIVYAEYETNEFIRQSKGYAEKCSTIVSPIKLTEVENPAEEQAYYRVEEQFTNAIRGTEQVNMVSFETGVHYMEWTEAVIRSAQTGQAIYLPL